MRLWTIQTPEAWAIIERGEVLRAKFEHADEDFRVHYPWLMDRMVEKGIVRPEGCETPLWAWYQRYNSERRKPDLEDEEYTSFVHPAFLLELEVPSELVLLSDFSLWHHVLNYWYVPVSEKDDEDFCAELARHGLDFFRQKPLPDAYYDSIIRESWRKCLDLEFCKNNEYHGGGKCIQATLWEIRPEWVKQVTFIPAKDNGF